MARGRLPEGVSWDQILVPVFYLLAAVLLAVFAHSGLQGDYGLLALRRAELLERELEADLARARADRQVLQNLTRRLSPESLDLELLDERARAVLGYIRPDEIIVE